MGGEISQEEKQASLDEYANSFFQSTQWNGFEIDWSLERFSGYNSAAQLSSYRDQFLYTGGPTDELVAMQKLGSQLGGFGPVANAVGLGALIISLILENVAQSMGKPTMGTADILRRVFAEEKGNEVRDLMDEYMKRMMLYLRQQQDLIAHTRHLESQLSTQLTRLRNSMLTDNQMSTRLLNQWVNGAAFHTQMLIHLARLERSDGAVAVRAANIYNKDVNRLLEKYQSYLIDNLEGKYYTPVFTSVAVCCFFFEENKMRATLPYFRYEPITCPDVKYRICPNRDRISELVTVIMSEPQIRWATTYFSTLSTNIPTLVGQHDTFSISMQ